MNKVQKRGAVRLREQLTSTTAAIAAALSFGVPLASPIVAQQAQTEPVGTDSVRIVLRQVEVRTAIEVLSKYLEKPVLVGSVGVATIDLFETPQPVHVSQVPAILRSLVDAQGLEIREDSTMLQVLAVNEPDPAVTSASASSLRLFTIRLRHAQAEDVAAVLNQLFGSGDLLPPDSPQPQTARGRGIPVTRGNPATLAGEVYVVPDVPTNSLLVRASEADFQVLSGAVQELDIRPLQVLIEVIIVEARKDRRFEVGLSASLAGAEVGDGTVDADIDGTTLSDLVVRIMGLGRGRLDAVLTAARSRGDAEILSRPVLVAANNTEASLLVGTEQPFIQVSRSLPTDTPQRDQVVQYRDVGTQLTVVPTINQDGYVMLQIDQEMNQVTGETQFDAPVISSRNASTRLLVRDGQTVVIGGLTDEIVDQIRTGVPVLADLPVLGGLFGATRSRRTETELFLFITPTILYDDEIAEIETERRMPLRLRPLAPSGAVEVPEVRSLGATGQASTGMP